MSAPRRHRCESRRCRFNRITLPEDIALSGIVSPPAHDCVILPQSARIDITAGNRLIFSERGIQLTVGVATPTADVAGNAQRTSVCPTSRDGVGRNSCFKLPGGVVAPAEDLVQPAQPACMPSSRRNRYEFSCRRIGLASTIVTPAGDSAVCGQPARMPSASGN